MGKTHSCKYFRLQADEYIEGELTDAEMREFEAHIAECEECRREVESIRALNAILRSNREKVPDGLHSRIMDAVKAEPKPKKKALIFRRSALSAACFFICLSITLIIAMLPMWNPSNAGGMGVPNDPEFDECETQAASTDSALKSEGAGVPTDEADGMMTEPELVSPTVSSSATVSPENSPSDTAEETMVAAEGTAPPAEEMQEATEIVMAPEVTALPETVAPKIEAETTHPHNFKGNPDGHPTYDAAPEASSAPGGDEITLALLVVSGLLAVASFIAFLISLSSIRNTSQKKDKEE